MVPGLIRSVDEQDLPQARHRPGALMDEVGLAAEREGGAHSWLQLCDGAIATSDFTPGARSELAGTLRAAHVSVAAPECVWADALTKVLAQLGTAAHPLAQTLLQAHGAQAWVHGR